MEQTEEVDYELIDSCYKYALYDNGSNIVVFKSDYQEEDYKVAQYSGSVYEGIYYQIYRTYSEADIEYSYKPLKILVKDECGNIYSTCVSVGTMISCGNQYCLKQVADYYVIREYENSKLDDEIFVWYVLQ